MDSLPAPPPAGQDPIDVATLRPARDLGPCLLIPFREPDGSPMTHAGLDAAPVESARVKPERPPTFADEAAGDRRPARYLTAKGAPVRVYFPFGLPPASPTPRRAG